MRDGCNHRYLKGFLAGMIGGFVGSWAMNQFSSGVSKVQQAWEKSDHHKQKPSDSKPSGSSDEAATALLAERISHAVLGRDLTDDEKAIAEPLVHYGFGTLAGGLYGLLAELTPLTTKGAGTAYATAMWFGGDEVAVPKLRLSKSASEYPASVHAEALASHLVYGLTAEGVRRGVRAVL
jgi:putative membrane protein